MIREMSTARRAVIAMGVVLGMSGCGRPAVPHEPSPPIVTPDITPITFLRAPDTFLPEYDIPELQAKPAEDLGTRVRFGKGPEGFDLVYEVLPPLSAQSGTENAVGICQQVRWKDGDSSLWIVATISSHHNPGSVPIFGDESAFFASVPNGTLWSPDDVDGEGLVIIVHSPFRRDGQRIGEPYVFSIKGNGTTHDQLAFELLKLEEGIIGYTCGGMSGG